MALYLRVDGSLITAVVSKDDQTTRRSIVGCLLVFELTSLGPGMSCWELGYAESVR